MPLAVDVLLPLPLEPLRYLVPFGREPGPVGGRVAVPWQGGVRLGLAVGVEDAPATRSLELKEIIDWFDEAPYVHPGAVAAIPDLAGYAGVPQGVLLATLAPSGFREDLRYEVRAVEGADADIASDAWVEARSVDPAALELWRDQGLIHERVRRVEPTERVLVAVRDADEALAGDPQENQRVALAWLHAHGSAPSGAELARQADVPESAVRALVRKGYAAYREEPVPAPSPQVGRPAGALPAAMARLPDGEVSLVSGGRRIDRLAVVAPQLEREVRGGRTPLVLVPEGRFLDEAAGWLAHRMPVLVLSGESDDRVRAETWRRVATGPPAVLVSTYLGLMAPRAEPGTLVVTEAGAGTYKLPAGARLYVPEAARRLGGAMGTPVVATDVVPGPELEAWSSPEARLRLPLPRMRLHASDLGDAGAWPIGNELAQVLRQVEDRERQAVVLAPRRGFSGAFGCASCDWIAGCPNCDLSLRYHRREARLRCHQCGHEAAPPQACPNCGAADLAPLKGAGTEWIAQAIRRLVPSVPVLRYDADQRDDLTGLYGGNPGVVVGTTALLRIAPLPRLSLIAVASFDNHLHLADFRAEEEALRLLAQLPELGSGPPPLTVVQTYAPDHPILAALRADDPDAAVAEYLDALRERRRRFGYPPAAHLAKFQLSARDRGAALAAAQTAVDRLRTGGATDEEVLGPAPAPVSRVRGQHTMQLFVRSPDEDRFRRLLSEVDAAARGVRVRVDVDPRDVGEFLE